MAAPRTITHTFDEIADGAYVTIKNPLWLTTALTSFPDLPEGVDRTTRRRKGAEWLLQFVVDWAVPTMPEDDSDPELLTDLTVDTALACPSRIETWIVNEVVTGSRPL